jgi:RHS repeat-associated protein
LYAGEQFDHDLGLYYNRARYLEVNRGRFWSQDSYEGSAEEPASLHKYSYGNNDPVNRIDPSGHMSFKQKLAALAIITILAAIPTLYSAKNFGQSQIIGKLDSPQQCKIQVRISRINFTLIGFHAYIVTQDFMDKKQYYFRAGPNGSDILFPSYGVYRPGTLDYEESNTTYVDYNIPERCERVNKSFAATAVRVFLTGIPYNKFGDNSNRFVYTALSRAGLPADYIGELINNKIRPSLSVFPGWGELLKLDEKTKLPNYKFEDGFGEKLN